MITQFNKLFEAIDQSDTDNFLTFLNEEASFKFGNLEPVKGKENIRQFLNSFFDSIEGTDHKDVNEYNVDNIWFTSGTVQYTRKDGTTLTVPFCNKLEMDKNNLIANYQIFIDNSELYK